MKRSALKRHTYLQHGKPLKQTSDHRRREDRERAPILKALREGPCQARLDGCLGRATDGHEILSRARGGSITDPRNVIGVCRPCHSWITTHPKEATELGFLRHSWDWPLCAACEIPHDPEKGCLPGMNKTEQIAACGNSVPPAFSRALVEANYRDGRQRELWRGYELAAAGGGR